MRKEWKRLVSAFLTVVMIVSLAVVPASAASADVTLKLGKPAWAQDKTCTVDVIAESADGEAFPASGFSVKVAFEKEYLEFVDLVSKVDGQNPTKVTASTANSNGWFGLAMVNMNLENAEIQSGDTIAVITFKAKSGIEATPSTLTCSEASVSYQDGTESKEYVADQVGSIDTNVPGDPPALKTVTLAANSDLSSFNGVPTTVQATATGGKDDKNITAMVTWSIAPESAGKGVTIDAATGLISVAKGAKEGSYTIIATPDGENSSGEAKTATLTITRAAAAAAEVIVTGPSTIPVPKEGQDASTAEYTAEVKNQFGEVMTDASVTWSMTTTSGDGVTFDASTAKVTVTEAATVGKTVTVTATCGGESKSVEAELVEIQVTPVIKNGGAVYGDTWEQIVTGYTAKVGNTDVPGSYTLANPKAMPAAGEGRSTTMTFNSTDGRYTGITVPVTVNVAKRPITITLPAQKVEYDGDEHTSGNVEYTGAEVVDGAKLTCVPVEAVTKTDAGTYEVAYTCASDNYIVTVKGGDFVIEKAEVPAGQVSQKPLEDFKLYDDVDVSVTKDGDGNVTRISVRIPRNSAKENEIAEDLAKANKRIVLTVEDEDGTKYEFTIKSWKLKDGTTFNSTGSNIFVPDELVGVDNDAKAYLANHAPVLPEYEVRMTASATGGAGGGSSSGVWGDRGNQTINLTPMSIFTDVPDGYTFQQDIMWVYYRGVMKGTSANTFSPKSSTNRQQLWMVLGRISGSNPSDMATARAWAINTGVSDGSSPTGSLTRQQMVTMLYRWAQSKGYTGVTSGSISGYADASSVAGYARDAMAWAVGNGIITGSGNTLMPNGTATRAQFAAIMHRFCEKFGV